VRITHIGRGSKHHCTPQPTPNHEVSFNIEVAEQRPNQRESATGCFPNGRACRGFQLSGQMFCGTIHAVSLPEGGEFFKRALLYSARRGVIETERATTGERAKAVSPTPM
jgi:hypothetical protein